MRRHVQHLAEPILVLPHSSHEVRGTLGTRCVWGTRKERPTTSWLAAQPSTTIRLGCLAGKRSKQERTTCSGALSSADAREEFAQAAGPSRLRAQRGRCY